MSPDISMCNDHACPSSKRCYRHEAKPSEYRQVYADFGRKKGAEKCKAFILITVSTRQRTSDWGE